MSRLQRYPRIAIQKKGRLKDDSLNYLANCGIEFDLQANDLLTISKCKRIELVLVRSGDIPTYVEFGAVDYAILGENVLEEKYATATSKPNLLKKLGFAKCRLVLAVPENSKIKNIEQLDHERIATSYGITLKKFLNKQQINAAIINIGGSVEACPKLGLSDAIFDITETGNSLRASKLVEIAEVMQSQAVLIKSITNCNFDEAVFL